MSTPDPDEAVERLRACAEPLGLYLERAWVEGDEDHLILHGLLLVGDAAATEDPEAAKFAEQFAALEEDFLLDQRQEIIDRADRGKFFSADED